MPMELPSTFGPMMLPSTCWSTMMKITKYQALERIDQQHQQRTRHSADERTEERDDVRHADDDAYQQRIWHAQRDAADVADKASMIAGVEELAVYEAHEGLVGEVKPVEYLLHGINGEKMYMTRLAFAFEGLPLLPSSIPRR